VRLDIALLDCQVVSPHLLSLGASTLARRDFAARLEDLCVAETQRPFPGYWRQPITAYL
jgi:Leu/Phe-tRNA-protein transferase